ncbi:hypothetical protein BVI2075_530092 [Burkholderia vietnamiensis]|nr:hypothetical protein BVI2075_530092 [Burkholderia vietnamiensis]
MKIHKSNNHLYRLFVGWILPAAHTLVTSNRNVTTTPPREQNHDRHRLPTLRAPAHRTRGRGNAVPRVQRQRPRPCRHGARP